MWIIASLPFWLLGIIIVGLALIGFVECIKTDRTAHDIGQTFLGFIILMIGSGIIFVIAAKVAS